MDLKPTPKPRTTLTIQPVPAPRTHLSSLPPPPLQSINSNSLNNTKKNEKQKTLLNVCYNSITEKNLSKTLESSSQQLKDEFSKKMTVKDKTIMITADRNASLRLDKSIRNPLINRAISSPNNDTIVDNDRDDKGIQEERCVSLPECNDIFNSISFNSPLQTNNMKSVKNAEDLSEIQYNLPPPIYPPPPLPDESIYDKLQSINCSYNCSGRNSLKEDLDNTCEMKINATKGLTRSDSWMYYYSTGDELTASNITHGEDGRIIDEASSIIQSDDSMLSVRNSLYENWNVASEECNTSRRNSESVLFEFDPFGKTIYNPHNNINKNSDLILLETLLSTSSNDSMEYFQKIDEDLEEPDNEINYSQPPALPRRYDSLPKNEYDQVHIEEIVESQNLEKQKRVAVLSETSLISTCAHMPSEKHNLQLKCPDNQKPSSSSVIQKLKKLHDSTVHVRPVINFMKNKKLLRFKETNNDSTIKHFSKDIEMAKPKVNNHQIIPVCSSHRGIVYRSGVGIERTKELVMRVAVLTDHKITFYTDEEMSTVKEILQLDNIQSVHLLQDVHKVVDDETAHCIALISDEAKSPVHLFYIKNITERRIWAQRIVETLTSAIFPIKYTSDLIRAGWVHLKEGITGIWFSAWIVLQQRSLIYTRSLEPLEFGKLDLRKARCILIRDLEGPTKNSNTSPVLVIDSGQSTALHLTAQNTREVTAWRHVLYQAAINCGPGLCDQQLTADNIPVIVDKCINFIYTHGIMSEGIYRKGGSSSAVVRLLEAFRKDAWTTQITRGVYSEHDVATVLRRFLRDLPEPLLSSSIYESLCRVIDIRNDDERIDAYRDIIFPALNRVAGSTLRRILAHLHCLSQQSTRNRMTVENMSAIWAPTLMHAGRKSPAEEWNKCETIVVSDLIRFYPKLYQLSSADLAKEAKILQVLERHHTSNSTLLYCPPSGDIKIWIYLFEKGSGSECCNVTIGPQKTASDVCKELSWKSKLSIDELCLEEYILGGALQRPLHYTEKVLEVIARWGYCDLEDRKDNILILKRNTFYKNIVSRMKPPMSVSGELKFADTKTKYLKNYTFEFSQAKLCCYRDKACSVKLYEWKIEDIIWYLGHEPKRNPQMGWSITFILKSEKTIRTKDAPFFGYILAGAPPIEQYKWLAAMLFGEHQWNLLPSVINLMDP